jgi:hypothetical protein
MESTNLGSEPSASEQLCAVENDEANQAVRLATQQDSTASAQKSGGPRTKRGKEKSKLNAIKRGIFSRVVLLTGESRAEYRTLLEGLQDDLKPQGELENQLVDQLAMLLWRKRRLIIAEGAEIRKATEFLEWDEMLRQHDETPDFAALEFETGHLIHKITKSKVLAKCLSMLERLKRSIDDNGFDKASDRALLDRLYEDSDTDTLEGTIKDSYLHWMSVSSSDSSGSDPSELASPEQCKKNFLKDLKQETSRLKAYRSDLAQTESRRMEVEALRGSVPESPQLERLLRYETSLDRGFERTLNQLERIQRTRKGQPLPPTLNVNVAS